jgi:cytochrome c-type biogenesis protein CcmH/NrfF
MLGAGQGSRLERLGHEMICMCSCGQILMECNHVGCPVSPVMISELKDQLAGGGNDKAVLNWFVAKYGAIVLASPMRGGFDDVAWIMPIAVFVFATIGTGLVVWMWKKRHGGVALHMPGGLTSGDPAVDGALRDRIRKETEY